MTSTIPITNQQHNVAYFDGPVRGTSLWTQLLQAINLLIRRTGGQSGAAFGPMPVYTVATVPDATAYAYCWIFVSNETGGATMAFSDGSNWKRVSDLATVS